jgi:hypothetical protein
MAAAAAAKPPIMPAIAAQLTRELGTFVYDAGVLEGEGDAGEIGVEGKRRHDVSELFVT